MAPLCWQLLLAGRDGIGPFLGILYNYYKYDQKVNMNDDKYRPLTQAYEAQMPEGTSPDYPAAGALLFTRNSAE
ncbi:hypothetical protein [Lentilactobacillus hilgardii]|uniref:hypothetical protein n=1 Tax=Lentilactobacillus hilgardii TaxID=1588 RepID=UPI0021A51B76|nr:hypothetical protein [Lentilactobacillus hilgardii]MCT3400600.1 hypothetical protein [Lentilactobacillus hilgardii]